MLATALKDKIIREKAIALAIEDDKNSEELEQIKKKLSARLSIDDMCSILSGLDKIEKQHGVQFAVCEALTLCNAPWDVINQKVIQYELASDDIWLYCEQSNDTVFTTQDKEVDYDGMGMMFDDDVW